MKVNNLSKNPEQFVVAREGRGELWYWGSWSDFSKAYKAARIEGGIVIPISEID